MELLNRNHRKKALLRLGAMGFLVLALTVTTVFAFHQAYANQGQDRIAKLEKELQDVRAKSSVELNALQNQLNRMKQIHKEELADKVPDAQIDKLKDEINDLKKEKRQFEEESKFYKNELMKCQMQN